jgi:uncharacterized protein YwqG
LENIFKTAGLEFDDQNLQQLHDAGGIAILEHLHQLAEKHFEGALLVSRSVGKILLKNHFSPDIVAYILRITSDIVAEDWLFASVVSSFGTGVKVPYERVPVPPRPEPPPSKPYQYKGFNLISPSDYQSAFQEVGLGEKWPIFEKYLKPEIRIELTRVDESQIPIGISKIGGRPDLPSSTPWPSEPNEVPLSFLAQFNLSELPSNGVEYGFPSRGMLYFFYSSDQSSWGDQKEDDQSFKCIFIEKPQELQRLDFPPSLMEGKFHACKLAFQTAFGLPNSEYDFVKIHLSPEENEPFIDASIHSATHFSKLLGHAYNVQGAYMEQECVLAPRGYALYDLSKPEIKQLVEAEKGDWILLFQLDSEPKPDMCWGDVGRLYFWIKKQDFENRRFDRVWQILQCY